MNHDDTIVAPATVPGTGAITILRVSGPDCFSIVDKVVSCRKDSVSDAPGYTIRFGRIFNPDGSVLDEVLVSVFRAPNSYTGEDSVEISCHASSYIASEVLRLLCDAGARPAGPGEFTNRAFLNGKMDLAQAEAVADVISSTGSASLRVAMNQLRGGFSKELMNMRSQLLEMTSLMELELDFSEEDVEFADRGKLTALLDSVIAHIHALTDSFKAGNAIRNGVPVAIVGAVNSGKSTLLNALLGDDRAIVSDVAGTTRDTIEETMVIDGVLFRFIDTAGLRQTSDIIENIGIDRSFKKLSEASVVLILVDASEVSSVAADADSALTVDEAFSVADIASVLTVGAASSVADVDSALTVDEADANDEYSSAFIGTAASVDESAEASESSENSCFSRSNEELFSSISDILSKVDFESQKVAVLFNKSDLLPVNKNVSTNNDNVSFTNKEVFSLNLSAKTGFGLDSLKKWLSETQKNLTSDPDQTVITNLRHYTALSKASEALVSVKQALAVGLPADLIAEDLRQALHHLGTIFGEVTPDEVLGEIFSKFCIGK